MRLTVFVGIVLLAQGCAHHQLGFITTKQAHTVEDVHTQQVLDNLAKFAHNPHALPHYSFPSSGSSNVDASVDGGAGFFFSPHRLTSWMFDFGGSRSIRETYTMTPVNDPRKLELMRCAYQRAISTCCCAGESGCCPDCEKRFNKFYLGTERPSKVRERVNGKIISEATVVQKLHRMDETYGLFEDVRIYSDSNYYNQVTYHLLDFMPDQQVDILYVAKEFQAVEGVLTDDEKKLQYLLRTDEIVIVDNEKFPVYKLLELLPGTASEYRVVKKVYVPKGKSKPARKERALFVDGTVDLLTRSSGKVTAECLLSPCWFKVGKKCDVPRCNPCAHVGHHCGTYIWVPPCGSDQLAQLTLAILDIALNDPPAARTKEVVAYLDKNQQPTTKTSASYKVTAVVPISGSAKSVHPPAPSEAVLKAERDFNAASQSLDSMLTSILLNENTQQLKALFYEFTPNAHSKESMTFPNDKLTRKDLIEIITNQEFQEQLTSNKERSNALDRELLEVINKYDELERAENYLHAVENAALYERQSLEAERAELEYLPPVRTPVPNAGYLQFRQNLDALAPTR